MIIIIITIFIIVVIIFNYYYYIPIQYIYIYISWAPFDIPTRGTARALSDLHRLMGHGHPFPQDWVYHPSSSNSLYI